MFILLLSGIADPSSQHLSNSSSMDVKEEEINVLGDGGPEINAISIDIKIQKVDETGSGIAEFFDNINVYVGDTIRFNVIVTNLIQYNLSDIKIINKLPSSYFLTFIEGYNEENKISAVSLKDELLTWEIEELHIGEVVTYKYDMRAIHETEIGGAVNFVNCSGSLNLQFFVELKKYKDDLIYQELELKSIYVDINSTENETELTVNNINDLIFLQQQIKQDLIDINNLINTTLIEISDVEQNIQFTNDEIQVSEEINALIMNFGFSTGNGENGDGTSKGL